VERLLAELLITTVYAEPHISRLACDGSASSSRRIVTSANKKRRTAKLHITGRRSATEATALQGMPGAESGQSV